MEVVGLIASSVTLLEMSLKTVGFFQEMATVQDDFRCLQEVTSTPSPKLFIPYQAYSPKAQAYPRSLNQY
ncbi:unnamed protein product [Clonostachys rosea f. rosea IK726]|uniref:Uncharacterized protein n=1 Tax=Clonostachys rosea f. rosea IK726 TaxID=1349383 RepID=A0ACA9TGG4_BIOOC|nr:unnamed protein product [Clonostachys rosea f. rosea IK726]